MQFRWMYIYTRRSFKLWFLPDPTHHCVVYCIASSAYHNSVKLPTSGPDTTIDNGYSSLIPPFRIRCSGSFVVLAMTDSPNYICTQYIYRFGSRLKPAFVITLSSVHYRSFMNRAALTGSQISCNNKYITHNVRAYGNKPFNQLQSSSIHAGMSRNRQRHMCAVSKHGHI